MSELYIGLMSGTSLDGIDAGLVDFSNNAIRLIEFHYLAFSDELRQRIQQISQAEQAIHLQDYGALDAELGCLFAETTLNLLKKANIPASDIAINDSSIEYVCVSDIRFEIECNIAHMQIAMDQRSLGNSLYFFADH